ncbi:MAG: FHA domain-containing protein [Nitrospiraceae bacterium]|nr:FHA domain-containing protein [Nitrospiraceae bacterium]
MNRPDMIVGRHTECDIRLPLPDVSRRHCRLQFVEGCWQRDQAGVIDDAGARTRAHRAASQRVQR